MSFSIDCLTLHPPSPSKCLIHSGRFALSERDSRLPHAPTPRGRRQPHVDMPARRLHQHHERSYPQVVSTGLCMAVGVCGMSPFFLCATPVRDLHTGRAPLPEAPGPGRHAPWDRIPRYRVLAENPGIPSDQSHSHSRESRGRPSTAATAHSSSSCNLSAVTSGSPERAIAPPSPQFYTGSRRICG